MANETINATTNETINATTNEVIDVTNSTVVIPPIPDVPAEETTTDDAEIIKEYEQHINRKTYKQIIEEILNKPNVKRINNVKVKNTTLTEETNYTRVTFTLDNYIKAYTVGDDGKETKTFSKFLFTSTYALAAVVKEDENLSYLGNIIVNAKDNLGIIFNGATLTVLQEEVNANEDYINPFSTNPTPQNFNTKHIINYITGIKLSNTGQRMADKIADKIADKLIGDLI